MRKIAYYANGFLYLYSNGVPELTPCGMVKRLFDSRIQRMGLSSDGYVIEALPTHKKV